ncbi:MAG TPA: AgmX/PglI C-terminal domain-containing protein [Polyangiaceae bacterium]
MRALLLLVVASCASGTPATSTPTATPTSSTETATATPTPTDTATATPTPTPTDTATATPSPSATPTPGPVPTGGSVLIGDINAPKGFNPKPTIVKMQQQLVDCFNQARAAHPDLRGKVTLRINVNETGAVNGVEADPAAGGHANDPTLVSCISDAMTRSAHFPKPGGMATVVAPLVFRP